MNEEFKNFPFCNDQALSRTDPWYTVHQIIFFGDSTLNRQGFAAVAIAAGVPIIPVFTENIREATLCLSGRMNVGRGLWEQIYEKTKMPLVPMYGLFPVKLRTHLGKPIFPKPGFYS